MDDYRYRSQQSPRTEAPMNSLVSPVRNGRPMPPQPVSQDPRAALPRRFTTDSGRVPTLSTISSSQRLPEPQEYPTATQYKVQLLEKKKIEYEKLREQKRRFEAEMQKLDQQARRDEFELAQMQEDLGRPGAGMSLSAGPQSEPTTPPEYRETSTGFPTMFSRPNRYSTSSMISPPGLATRPGRSGSQLTSPQSGILQSRFYHDQIPSRSVPGSRRNSDDDEKEEALRQDPTSHRSTNATNRYSMPVTRRGNLYDNIDQTNAAGFLFGDDDSSMSSGNYVAMDSNQTTGFPQLHHPKGNPNVLSASSAAVELASGENTPTNNGWGNLSRHRQSLSTLTTSDVLDASLADASPISNRPFRRSLDLHHAYSRMDHASEGVSPTPTSGMSPSSQVLTTPPKLQTSFSSNNIPTVKDAANTAVTPSNVNAHAQQHFHNHNASIGRIPPGAVKRHSRELSSDSHVAVTQAGAFPSIQSALQANAPAFAVASSQPALQSPTTAGAAGAASATNPPSSLGGYQYYGGYNQNSPNGNGYNMNMMAMGMQNMNMNGYSPQNYTGYSHLYHTTTVPHHRDSQQRVIQQRRAQDSEVMNRYQNLPLEKVGGTIYQLCKDQHGCRYLQKQLENRAPDQIHMIWVETNQHVVELMTDPFGNYLCQKLLEYCSDDERTVLIRNAAPEMVQIATNQHGTRALQKMIEFVTTPEHVEIIIEALRNEVVELIQDLNGNHVIQKCLNKLTSVDADFIFQAVGNHCVAVGTHRHGCCVLQRCIDHASGGQKSWLVGMITQHATRLVQDPFGNYVVQYIIDLNEPTFTEPIVEQFRGGIVELSRHKFSSNVVEKCLRCASDESKDNMVGELLLPGEIEKLLKDSFGNYVVQTALEHSTYDMKHRLVDAIRPMLATIRGTPYGRRLAAKITQIESHSANASGQSTPADPTQGQISLRTAHSRSNPNQQGAPSNAYTNGGLNGNRAHGAYQSPMGLALQNAHLPQQQPHNNAYQGYAGPGMHSANGMHPGNGSPNFF
ncbi:ARM repeat-containing protein [Xylariaceae sp. FL0804]|nr:ARM repeat-containing protein [Xylariaceae sp. FL0804]